MNTSLTPLEQRVLALIVADKPALAEQLSQLKVGDRVYTGAGFYTIFGTGARAAKPRLEEVSDVVGALEPGGDPTFGFLLFTHDGAIFELEGCIFPNGVEWPADEDAIVLWRAPVFPAAAPR